MQRVAISVENNNNLFSHFDQFSYFMIYDIKDKNIEKSGKIILPTHEPCTIPKFLNSLKVNVMKNGGIGQRAINNFNLTGIKVISGIVDMPKNEIINHFIENKLISKNVSCFHYHHHSNSGN